MADISRRRLFGLFAGAAAAPMVGKAVGPLMLGDTPIYYDQPGPFAYLVNPEIHALLQRRINQAHATMLENMKTRFYGPPYAEGLINLLETHDG